MGVGSSTGMGTYRQLVVDAEGETSILVREFSEVQSIGYSNVPQLCRSLDPSAATPTGVVFTQMNGENPWHHCPGPQIVVTLEGTWYVKTTDGVTTELPVGSVLFQDNTPAHPSALQGTTKAQHFSGSVTPTCSQMIVQLQQPAGPIPNSKDAKPPM